MNLTAQKLLVHAALIDHVRYWWADDGADYWATQENWLNGEIDGRLTRSIASRYNVSRCIAEGKEGHFSNLLRDHLDGWPIGLTERASRLLDFANKAKVDNLSHYNPCSAATKLAWFVLPSDWTLYDRFAVDALNVSGSSASEKMKKFYLILENADITHLWHEMREILVDAKLPHLWPERITDKVLWLVGGNKLSMLDRTNVKKSFDQASVTPLELASDRLCSVVLKSKFWKLMSI
jgi:hypothetical protein